LDGKLLQQLCVTHILNVTRARYNVPLDGMETLQIAIDDDESEDIFRHFDRTTAFVRQALDAKGTVLIHCEYGVSRSATVVAAYLMLTEGLSAVQSLKCLRWSREIVAPNRSFLAALVEWDVKLHGAGRADSLNDLEAV